MDESVVVASLDKGRLGGWDGDVWEEAAVDVVDAFASAAATRMAAFAATDSGEDMVTRRRWDKSIRWRVRGPQSRLEAIKMVICCAIDLSETRSRICAPKPRGSRTRAGWLKRMGDPRYASLIPQSLELTSFPNSNGTAPRPLALPPFVDQKKGERMSQTTIHPHLPRIHQHQLTSILQSSFRQLTSWLSVSHHPSLSSPC
jgi:hypothetical protein